MLEAAFDVFAEVGFGRSTVEQVCERAGFTRGAFYSNFTSLEELFLAMWEQRSAQLITDLREVLEALEASGVGELDEIVERFDRAVPMDGRWYGITAEFTAHALRNPELRSVMVARERAIVDTLLPILEPLLHRAGRTIPDAAAYGQALVAAHDGTSVQVLMEPDSPRVRARRVELFREITLAYTTPVDGA